VNIEVKNVQIGIAMCGYVSPDRLDIRKMICSMKLNFTMPDMNWHAS